jgi:hypothetical protein
MDKRRPWIEVFRAIIILWILVSPWVLMHVSVHPVLPLQITGVALLNFFAVGVALIIISVAPSEIPTAWRGRAGAAVGAWLIVSPFVLGFEDSVLIWNAVIPGIIVVLMSAWSREDRQHGTGAA